MLRETRRRHGLTQRRLAVRSGVTQPSISRIERGLESPGLHRMQQLLVAMGERPVITIRQLEHDVDLDELRAGCRLSHEERLREASAWNLAACKLEIAGARARRAGHPATRRAR